jgi:hypothetical protein
MVGSLWTRITKIFDRTPQIETQFPTAIAGVQGTIYRAEVAPDSATNVRVYEGAVELKSKPSRAQRTGPPTPIGPPRQVPGPTEVSLETWVKLVRAYQEIRIAKNGRPGEPAPFTDRGAGLQWVRWNQARDRELDAER